MNVFDKRNKNDACKEIDCQLKNVAWFATYFYLAVINELDGLKKDFQVDKYDNLQHAQYVLENARYVEMPETWIVRLPI